MYFKLLCVAAILVGVVIAGEVNYSDCDMEIPGPILHCNVTSVSISGCNKPSSCTVEKGITTNLQFQFTPNFGADGLYGMYYLITRRGRVNVMNHSEVGEICEMTRCPFVKGESQTLTYPFTVYKKERRDALMIRFHFYNDYVRNTCCFETIVHLK